MTPEQLAKSIWVKRHMAGVLAARAQQLGNQRERREAISTKIGRLNQQVTYLRRKLETLEIEDLAD